VGIATTFILICVSCPESTKTTQSSMETMDGHQNLIFDRPRFRICTKTCFNDYPLHYSLVLLMQQLGCGLEGIRAILSHLGITDTIGDWEKWRQLLDTVGEAQQYVANECMHANMIHEIKLSQETGRAVATDSKGIVRQGVAASVDMGWQKRSSGNRYDSPSGVALMIGALTKKVMWKHVCSKLCSVCLPFEKRKEAAKENVFTPENLQEFIDVLRTMKEALKEWNLTQLWRVLEVFSMPRGQLPTARLLSLT